MRDQMLRIMLGCLVLWAAGCGSGSATREWVDEGDVESDVRSVQDVAQDAREDAARIDGANSADGNSADAAEFDGGDEADAAADTHGDDAIAPVEDTGPSAPDTSPNPPDASTPPDPHATMKFGTFHWNIAGGKENSCRADKIKRAVMRYVRNAPQPIHFISLNEVCHSQYIAIRNALRNEWNKSNSANFSVFQSNSNRQIGSAIFSRRNLAGVTRKVLGHDQYGDRYLICGRQDGRRIRVCTAHLSPADHKARAQLEIVLNKIERWWENRDNTVIIAGDFNIHPNDPGFNAMYAQALDTPNNRNNRGKYRELDDSDSNHCRGYGQRSQPWATGGPCNTGGKIDFIFARANYIVNGNYSAKTFNIPRDCTGRCSDHRALRGYARIRYRTD